VVDGWAEENAFTVLFCTGNLALREMYEAVRDDVEARVLIVDRSRVDARIPLFHPDLAAEAPPKRHMTLSLRDFLVERTGDPHWPHLVDDRNLSRLIVANLPDTLRAYEQLRGVSPGRFSDSWRWSSRSWQDCSGSASASRLRRAQSSRSAPLWAPRPSRNCVASGR